MKRDKLTYRELTRMRVGDTFVAFYAKDDDPRDIRINYETHTITSIALKVAEGCGKPFERWEVSTKEGLDLDFRNESNYLDSNSCSLGGRGQCYLYKTKG